MSGNKRYHPPSEDFAECKLKLKWTALRVEELTNKCERLTHELKLANDYIADILDDTGGEIHAK